MGMRSGQQPNPYTPQQVNASPLGAQQGGMPQIGGGQLAQQMITQVPYDQGQQMPQQSPQQMPRQPWQQAANLNPQRRQMMAQMLMQRRGY